MTKPLEKRQLERLEPSVHVTPEITLQVEHFHTIASEMPRLFEAHGRERDEIVDPDWQAFFSLALDGTLRILTARDNGVLIGYVFNLVRTHLHIKSKLHCFVDGFYIDPAYRGGALFLRMMRRNDDLLKEWGVKRCYIGVDVGRVGRPSTKGIRVFERLGYKAVETFMRKDFE
jgi:GNAT superfamily N-acetyltransferase